MTLTDDFCETFSTKADCVGAMARIIATADSLPDMCAILRYSQKRTRRNSLPQLVISTKNIGRAQKKPR